MASLPAGAAAAPREKDLLRFITCGSVDDGKSTLIGRLLYDSALVPEDQLAALEADSRRIGTQGADLDMALLVDGLTAEREQGITIDVAYRYFATDRRNFIVADTPGHEQYTRNMVTGASTADVAVVLVDARKGMLTQTRRHTYLASLLGVRRIVLAVTKMDLVDWSQALFDEIVTDYRAFADSLGDLEVTAIPVSGLRGDNVVTRGPNAPWYAGPTLRGYLETVEVDSAAAAAAPLRLPIQWVNRPHLDFRGFAGRLASGRLRPGDAVVASRTGQGSTIARIVTFDGDLPEAVAGQSVTVTLSDEIDLSRGDVLVHADARAEVADQFEATVVWMAEEAMLPGRLYTLKLGTGLIPAEITDIRHTVNVNTLEETSARVLELNDIGVCHLALGAPIAFDPYTDNRDMGGFILIDRQTNATVGAGMIRFALRRSHNVHWQALDVSRRDRARAKGQQPAVVWFTGLSGAGKSTIANLVERQLLAEGRHTYLIDGDNLRHGLNKDLGFTDADRVENVRRAAEVGRLMADAGLIVLVSLISPFAAERRMARDLMAEGEFVEVFVDAPLDLVEARDAKGLYRKARAGELKNFTGIDSPYEAPLNPELRIDSVRDTPEAASRRIVDWLRQAGRLGPSG